MKKYSIIYADPPWFTKSRGVLSPYRKYKMMSLKDIKSMRVDTISEDDSALFIWAISTQLPKAIVTMMSWGFEYRTVAFCWIKTSKSTGMPNCRVGSYTLNGMELCLLGLKGKMKRQTLNVRQVIMHPRGIHSAKPAIVRTRIVELYGNLPRIELFARDNISGWDCWGNGVGSDEHLFCQT
jgi:site-specific DNA-methyltransferase (adenine-specific)